MGSLSLICGLAQDVSCEPVPQAIRDVKTAPSPVSSASSPQRIAQTPLRLTQSLKEREVWALELAKWAHFCASRSQSDPLGACQKQLNAISAYSAIYRTRRIRGFFESSRLELKPHQLDALLDIQTLDKLNSLERARLLDLSGEALLATGDLQWLTHLLTITRGSLNALTAPCTLGEACAEELISVLGALSLCERGDATTLRARAEKLNVDAPLLMSTLFKRASTLRAQGRALTARHPNGSVDADAQRGGATSWWSRRARLAAHTLDAGSLRAWVSAERVIEAPPQALTELKGHQFGVNVERALGLGALLDRGQTLTESGETTLTTTQLRALEGAYHQHARAVMQVYLKQYRDPAYGVSVPARGALALTRDRSRGRLGLEVPARRWLDAREKRVRVEALPASGLRAEGMFSKIALRDQDGRRGLYFVRPNGAQLLETEVDLSRPDLLQVRYTQDMLATYPMLGREPQRALLIGLGGGAMVHALHAYDPKLTLDVVEIDPVVVQFARQHFGVSALEYSSATRTAQRPQGSIKVFTEDGFDFLKRDQPARYDMIWMDAFLQPTSETDSAGSPLNLKTRDFLRSIAARHLTESGVIAINLNHHAGLQRDIDTIRASFPSASVWQVPETGNYIALGLRAKPSQTAEQLRSYAAKLSWDHASPFRYEVLLERVLAGFEPSLP